MAKKEQWNPRGGEVVAPTSSMWPLPKDDKKNDKKDDKKQK